MRVTKAVREYIEEEVWKKYREPIENVGADYKREKASVEDEIRDIVSAANEEAMRLAEQNGFVIARYSSSLVSLNGRIEKPDMEDEIRAARNEWEKKCNNKIKKILFDLEMGETQKAELKEMLDNLTVD